jgi:D-3-phosphoglycerate dehydrogenase / 2-oxoglutarate reductase
VPAALIIAHMSRFRVVLIEHGYASVEHERRIVSAAGGEFIDAESLPLPEALRRCAEADGILCRRLEITAAMIQKFSRCKILVRYGVGTDNVDLDAATSAGIMVGHVPNYCVDEVSTHAITLLLACVRKVVVTHERVQRGAWDVHRSDPIYRLAGHTLGLVGLGRIGGAVARKLRGWNLQILATDPYAEPQRAQSLDVQLVSLEGLFRESDYLSLHCPLLPETRHLVNRESLALARPGAILVNTARGPVVDTTALLQALAGGRLAGVGLDVFEEEPLPSSSPLRTHRAVILTDHTAWYSEESQIQLQETAAQEIVRACTGGLPLSLANPEVLDRLGRFKEWTPSDEARWQLKRLAGQQTGHRART